MSDQRNLILAIALSVAILVGFEFFSAKPKQDQPATAGGQTESIVSDKSGSAPAAPSNLPVPSSSNVPTAGPSAQVTAPGTAIVVSREAVLAKTARVRIESARLRGSLSLVGGYIDDLILAGYREERELDSPEIVLLSPKGASKAYYADFGWVPGQGEKVPNNQSVWTASSKTLSPEAPVTLTWNNGQGLTFMRTYDLDDDYMFTVTQRVKNTGTGTATLYPYGLLSRHNTPEVTGFYILHEGLLGVFDETLTEVDYDDLQETGRIEQKSTGGWIGITDKYWLTALIPNTKQETGSRFVHTRDGNLDKYQVDYLGGAVSVATGATGQSVTHLFAGAKELNILDKYEEQYGIDKFDLAIDFGWFYFLTKPIFYLLIYINDHVGNYGLGILLLTVMIKMVFFPLANKSYRAMSNMKKLQPEMVKLREQYGDDKVRLNQEMMALYKREKANPASGCLPMVVQIPVFFALYKVLFVTIEMRHAPFYGWIHDLSAPDPTTVWNLFGLIPWDPSTIMPAAVMIGVWPLIMGLTMFLQQKLNPQPPDPLQAKIFMFLPIMFTFMLAQFPAGLVIYWAWNNLLSIIQQKVIMVRMGVK